MPRYYFDVRRGQSVIEDTEGADLPNLSAAIERAADDALEIIRQEPDFLTERQYILIRKDGDVIMSVSFEHAMWRSGRR